MKRPERVTARTRAGYASNRDEAFRRDPTVKTFKGACGRFSPVDEWIRKCDAFFAKIEKATPSKQSQDLMAKAFSTCTSTMFSPGTVKNIRKAWAKYQETRDQAIKTDSKIRAWNGRVRGRIVQKYLSECDAKLKALLDGAEARTAKTKEVQTKRREESRKEDEARRKAFKKLVASLKGDRRRLLALHGHRPAQYKGRLEKARVWIYKSYPSNRGPRWHCTTRYTFKGNKLVKKSKRGPHCAGCTTCP